MAQIIKTLSKKDLIKLSTCNDKELRREATQELQRRARKRNNKQNKKHNKKHRKNKTSKPRQTIKYLQSIKNAPITIIEGNTVATNSAFANGKIFSRKGSLRTNVSPRGRYYRGQ